MAEPARRTPREERSEREPGDEEDAVVLQRWVEQPDGHFELVELPLTPELYLNPQLEDKMTQGKVHANLRRDLADHGVEACPWKERESRSSTHERESVSQRLWNWSRRRKQQRRRLPRSRKPGRRPRPS